MTNNSKPCHNCRRRRLRCDRSWPSCHKCAVSGQECLGYGKVFVWTQAIDTSGNSSKPPGSSGKRAAGRVGGAETAAATHGIATAASTGAPGQLPPPPPPITHRQSRAPAKAPSSNQQRIQELDDQDEDRQEKEDQEHQPTADQVFSAGALTDPIFQDLDRNSRYYLSHFADRVCKDLVARDDPGNNPFRELIPLTKRHPLLLQILVATSAIHWANIFRPCTDIPTGLVDPGGYLAQLRSQNLVSRQALIDALTAKQKAMGHLRGVLDTLDPAGSEVALASMHFFIKFDLIDLGKQGNGGWRAHLEGASSILALLTPESLGSSENRMLRDWIIADCFIYHILGSTLTSGGLAARIARYAFQLLPVMKRVEVNSYLSCPPEILQIILVASQLSYDLPNTDWTLRAADEAVELVQQAIDFDIPGWAAQLQQLPNVGDIESRIHVASAHRSAACLYILQAIPLVRAVQIVDADFLVEDILSHLSCVGEHDPYFKATSWPTFIAGAETRDQERRTWTLQRLLSIWAICSWGYIFTAIEMLKATWQMQDAGGRGPDGSGVNWLQGLKNMGFDYLIV